MGCGSSTPNKVDYKEARRQKRMELRNNMMMGLTAFTFATSEKEFEELSKSHTELDATTGAFDMTIKSQSPGEEYVQPPVQSSEDLRKTIMSIASGSNPLSSSTHNANSKSNTPKNRPSCGSMSSPTNANRKKSTINVFMDTKNLTEDLLAKNGLTLLEHHKVLEGLIGEDKIPADTGLCSVTLSKRQQMSIDLYKSDRNYPTALLHDSTEAYKQDNDQEEEQRDSGSQGDSYLDNHAESRKVIEEMQSYIFCEEDEEATEIEEKAEDGELTK